MFRRIKQVQFESMTRAEVQVGSPGNPVSIIDSQHDRTLSIQGVAKVLSVGFSWICTKTAGRFMSKLSMVVALEICYYSNFFGSARLTHLFNWCGKPTRLQRAPVRSWLSLIFSVFRVGVVRR